ncbi:MAG: AraC family transcriptional regulator [Ruminococcaceae bacterium]|nr:AraC family transcriptional regulator [Oscillospiraceae bacterium]
MLPLFNDTILLDRIPIRVSTQAIRNKDYFHFHRRIQLCFLLSGKMKHTICGKEYIQQAGSCAFLLPYMPHLMDSSESEDTPILAHIWFHEDFLKSYGYNFLSYGDYANFNGHKIPTMCDFQNQGDAPARIIHELINEFAREKNLSLKRLAELIAELFSLACTEPMAVKKDSLFGKQLKGIETSADYIQSHFRENLSLDELCEVSGMSRRSFTEHFKHITKLTPVQYILSVRLQTAFKLIMEKKLFFDEIAKQTGLGSRANLARVFQKNLGTTPTQFVDEYIKNTTHFHEQSIYSRYKWLYDLKFDFNNN